MDAFRINGGASLKGEVTLSGAKNGASKMMMASMLTEEPVLLRNVPRQRETEITQEIIEIVGSDLEWRDDHTVELHMKDVKNTSVMSLSRKNRISVLALAPLLHRTGEAFVPFAGGDKIGPRPVNWHIDALEKMGADIEHTPEGYKARVDGRLNGALIELPYPSVGTTEQVIFAGVLANDRTVIRNAAVEPEIVELVKMLQKMGAIIEIGAGREIEIIGVDALHGCEARVVPDAIEAASYACLSLGTRGDIFVKDACHEHMVPFLNAVRRIGGGYEVHDNGIRFFSKEDYHGIEIETDTYPGFRTDWQQPFVVVLTQAEGTSVVHETVYEDRFGYTKALNKMGADIRLTNSCLGETNCRFKGNTYKHCAIINGPTPLQAANVEVPDIRAGLAYVLAALVAEGESTLTGIHHLDRGYERLEDKLQSIGADIERVDI
jgi:UDP-N-acetylglucosamine 1-carboxyvinyltransferase